MLLLHVFRMISVQAQVLKTIVEFVPVDMVDSFLWPKIPTKVLFNYQSVFVDIAPTAFAAYSMRMVWSV